MCHQHEVRLPNGDTRFDKISCPKEDQTPLSCLLNRVPKRHSFRAPEGTPWKEECPFCRRDANREAAEKEKLKREAAWRAERDIKNEERRKWENMQRKSDCCMC
jgi:hypothetical protein